MENSQKVLGDGFNEILQAHKGLIVRQKKEWAEIIVDWETRNKYELQSPSGEPLGAIIERSGGFFDAIKRVFLRSHRALQIEVLNLQSKPLAHLSRKFFFFFSDLFVTDVQGIPLGSVHRRFGIIYKKYVLLDSHGRAFATIKAPLWRLWTFPVYNLGHRKVGVISKKWQGLIKEVFTDADQFYIDFGNETWSVEQKVTILAAALSIDFDFFENNQGKSGGFLGS